MGTTSTHLTVNRKKKHVRKLYQRWSDDEKQALILGVEQYGLGQWKLIKEDSRFGPILVNRSNVDCKDKWRQTTTPVKTQRRAAPLSPPLQAIVSSPMHNDRTFQNAMNMPHSPMGSPRSPPSHTRGVLAELSPAPSPLRLIQQPTFEPLPSSPSSSEDGSPATRDEGGCTVM
uniref:Uncharacterized protein n=2 Tax=Ostreococcus mediterraneus TaxID=1486918 RepID=A0A6U0CDF1_9CHLO